MKGMYEFYSGTKRMSMAFNKLGWMYLTVDRDYPSILQKDIFDITRLDLLSISGDEPLFLWFSPPCTSFSVASISKHWRKEGDTYLPISSGAIEGLCHIEKCLQIASWFPNAFFVIENPRGIMRKIPRLKGLRRYTVTYCQYGETRMKPTDLFCNAPLDFRPPCKNGSSCHEAAPRGSRTGTQGIKGAHLRAALPFSFCEAIAEQINRRIEDG